MNGDSVEQFHRSWLVFFLALVNAPVTTAQETVTINFDNTGEENSITTFGITDFSFKGSVWSGGEVNSKARPGLYPGLVPVPIDSLK